MKAKKTFLIFAVTALASIPVHAQNRWGEDRLIGHFDDGLTQIGPGYSHFNCIYGNNSDLFVAFVESATSEDGDFFTIRKSFDDGQAWAYQKIIESGSNSIFSPDICTVPGSDMILASCITVFPGETIFIDTYRYSYGNLTYLGFTQADFSYPGAGNPVYAFTVSNDAGGEIWLFTVDDNDWLFLTRSSDGETWTASVPVAANVTRPHADTSADGHVAVVWSQPTTGQIMCAISDSQGNFQPVNAVSGSASPDASPIVGWEHIGAENLGVVWHSDSGESFINLSFNSGASWGADILLGEGKYPYLNRYVGTRRVCACFTTDIGEVYAGSASTIAGLPGATFYSRSGYEAYQQGPARVAFGQASDQIALFYLTPTTQDFWFNSSTIMGIEGEEETLAVSVTAGPNPSSGSFSVTASGFPGMITFSVYSADGRIVLQPESGSSGVTVNTADLPAGVYTVVAEDGVNRATCRVVSF